MTRNRASRSGAKTTRWYAAYRARMDAGLEQCRYPGCTDLATTFDKLIPNTLGGRYVFDNVTLACRHHNEGRAGQQAPTGLRSLAEEELEVPAEQRWSLLNPPGRETYYERKARTGKRSPPRS